MHHGQTKPRTYAFGCEKRFNRTCQNFGPHTFALIRYCYGHGTDRSTVLCRVWQMRLVVLAQRNCYCPTGCRGVTRVYQQVQNGILQKPGIYVDGWKIRFAVDLNVQAARRRPAKHNSRIAHKMIDPCRYRRHVRFTRETQQALGQ